MAACRVAQRPQQRLQALHQGLDPPNHLRTARLQGFPLGRECRLLRPGHGDITGRQLGTQLQHFFLQDLVACMQLLQAGGAATLCRAIGQSQGFQLGQGAFKAALGCVVQGSGSGGMRDD